MRCGAIGLGETFQSAYSAVRGKLRGEKLKLAQSQALGQFAAGAPLRIRGFPPRRKGATGWLFGMGLRFRTRNSPGIRAQRRPEERARPVSLLELRVSASPRQESAGGEEGRPGGLPHWAVLGWAHSAMVDIHSHILWELDDGSGSLEESIAMLQAARESGTTDIVATPHSNSEFAYQPDVVDQKIRELTARTGGAPKMHRGCDFHLSFDNLDHLLDQPGTYTINGKQYLLVECPDFHVGRHTETVLQRLVDAGIVPIVTHPERNQVLQRNRAA